MKQSSVPGKIDHITVLADPHDISPYLSKDKKTIVLFEMTACPFCRMFQPRFLELTQARSQDSDFARVKLDDHRNPLWQHYGINAVPTVMVFSNGQIQSRLDAIPLLGISKNKWADFCARI